MVLIVLAIVIMVVLLFVLNTKRWRAVGRGLRQTKSGFETEIQTPSGELED